MRKNKAVLVHKIGRRFLPALLLLTAAVGVYAQPTFSINFSPSTIGPGSTSTLTYTIDNTGGAGLSNIDFSNTLPAGVVIATPANTSFNCDKGTLSAPDGGTIIDFSDGLLSPNSICIISVNVTSAMVGTHMNVTGDLTSSAGNSGPAMADLIVDANRPGFSKSFSPGTVFLGERSRLTFTIDNSLNPAATNFLQFTDILPPGLVIAGPADVSITCSGGVLTAVPGTSTISLSSDPLIASVPANETCTISVDVVPTAVGMLGNTSDNLTFLQIFSLIPCGMASGVLEVIRPDDLLLVKAFTNDPVPPGGTATLRFTITNFNRDDTATNIAFSDDLDATLSGLVAVGLPQGDDCGTGSLTAGMGLLSFSGGTLGPGASCSFTVDLQVPLGAAAGAFPNATTAISADLGGVGVMGNAATDTLFIEPAPVLTKSFTDDPAVPGGTVTLEFTITNPSPTLTATDITFFDDFDVILPTAVSVPAVGFCGPASTATFTPLFNPPLATVIPARLTITGAELAPLASCNFSIVLDVATDAPNGIYPNATSAITATVGGVTVTGNQASDDLVIVAPPTLSKTINGDPLLPGGGTITIVYTLQHDGNAPSDATNISFSDDLNAVIPGTVITMLPPNGVCGALSTVTGVSTVSFSGGSLAPGEICTFSVDALVPPSAEGVYPCPTSPIMADVGGLSLVGLPASDDLIIVSLVLSKSFTDDPVVPGGIVTLEYTIGNFSTTQTANSITFTDNSDDVIPGMTFIPPPPATASCDPGSVVSFLAGNQLLVFSGGSLAPLTSCSFSVTLQVPGGALPGVHGSVTSDLIADIGGSIVILPPAVDTLEIIQPLSITKSFTDDPSVPGGTVTLEYTIFNTDLVNSVDNIAFSDDLDTALTGLASISPAQNNICGAGSNLSGAGLLTFMGGTLGPDSLCTFSVTLQVPAGVAGGSVIPSTSGPVTGTVNGIMVTGNAASDNLRIQGLEFSKSFLADTAPTGQVVLSFSLTNTDPVNPVSAIRFSDDLNAAISGMTVVSLPPAPVCGPGSTFTGSSLLMLENGSLDPGQTCVINVTVQIPGTTTPGTYLNTTSVLEASVGTLASASASLLVNPSPAFSKSFAPGTIFSGGISTLTFTIDNSASTIAATNLDFTDNLPAGVVIAGTPNVMDTCTGGTAIAVPASGTFSYSGGTVSAGVVCTVSVDVTSAVVGNHLNTSGDLTSSSGNSGPAGDMLRVNPRKAFSKSFAPSTILPGEISTLTFTIDNAGSTADATNVSFTDNLPAGVTIAAVPTVINNCTGGTVTAPAGGGTISYSGGTVAAGTVCTLSVDVISGTPGTHTNISGDLMSDAGNGGAAIAALTVSSPANLSGTLAVSLTSSQRAPSLNVQEGDSLFYTLVLINAGPATQLDDPASDEFSNTLPMGLSLVNVALVSGGGVVNFDIPSKTTTWNGSIPPQGVVELEIEATVEAGTGGSLLSVQGIINYDADGDGINDTQTVTDDPDQPGALEPTVVRVLAPIPTLSPLALLLFILAMFATAVWLRRRRLPSS